MCIRKATHSRPNTDTHYEKASYVIGPCSKPNHGWAHYVVWKAYLGVRDQLCLYPSLCPVLRSYILPQAKGWYRTEGKDAGMDTEITGEWSYYPIHIVNIPVVTLLGFTYT